jgi:hypothetical protein
MRLGGDISAVPFNEITCHYKLPSRPIVGHWLSHSGPTHLILLEE